MSDPITEIPTHIRSLPEEEQGPALVKAIHDRKAAEQLRAELNELATDMYMGVRGLDIFMEEREAVLRDVAARGLTPPKADDTPVTVRWACLKPTDPPEGVPNVGEYAVTKLAERSGFDYFLQHWIKKVLM